MFGSKLLVKFMPLLTLAALSETNFQSYDCGWLYGYLNNLMQQLRTYDSADAVWMCGQEYLVYCRC
jgi:hypothetical protein